MSKNKNTESDNIVLTDLDTGVTLNIPSSKVVTTDNYSHMDDSYDITIDTSTTTSNTISTMVTTSGIFTDDDFIAIYESPNDIIIRKRYIGHKKIQDISDIGMHTLEKMSKRGD